MNILIACEESQRVCEAFREKGHNAFSCDIQECSGGHPEWHIKGDVTNILSPNSINSIIFKCQEGRHQYIKGCWDLIIAHPPCQYLTLSGNAWYNINKYGEKARQRQICRENAIAFFMKIANANCPRIAIENPIGIMSTHYRKPDQIIHPWQFALTEEENTKKSTCLWLKGVPPLIPEHTYEPNINYHEWLSSNGKIKRQTAWYYSTRCLPHSERAKAASKTFLGIAKAMAEQWG